MERHLIIGTLRKIVVSIVGPRDRGKSQFLIRCLYQYAHEFDYIWVFCPSTRLNDDYEPFMEGISEARYDFLGVTRRVPDAIKRRFTFVSNIELDMIRGLVDDQINACDEVIDYQRTATSVEQIKAVRAPHTLFVFDDCLSTEALDFPVLLNHIASNGRHYNMSLMIVSQHLNRVPKTIRINSTYFIMFSPYSMQEAESFFEQFTTRKSRRELLRHVEDLYRHKYAMIITDNTKHAIRDRLFAGDADQILEGRAEPVEIPD